MSDQPDSIYQQQLCPEVDGYMGAPRTRKLRLFSPQELDTILKELKIDCLKVAERIRKLEQEHAKRSSQIRHTCERLAILDKAFSLGSISISPTNAQTRKEFSETHSMVAQLMPEAQVCTTEQKPRLNPVEPSIRLLDHVLHH